MKVEQDMERLWTEYLHVGKEIVAESAKRESAISQRVYPNPKDNSEFEANQKEIKGCDAKIAELCNRSRAIEGKAKGSLGIPALFGSDLPNVFRVAISLLIQNALSSTMCSACRDVTMFLDFAAGAHKPEDQLLVRESLTKDGVFRPHLHFEFERSIDLFERLSLREKAFRKLLGLAVDTECDEFVRALTLVPNKRR